MAQEIKVKKINELETVRKFGGDENILVDTPEGTKRVTANTFVESITYDLNDYIKDNQVSYGTTFSSKKIKQDLEGVLNSVVGGSPKGVYPSLTSLSQAKPTGDVGVYITSDNGNWNYWNGTSWVAGGTYQATKIEDQSIGEEKVKGVDVLNLYNEGTLVEGYVDVISETIRDLAGTYYSLIEVTEQTSYCFTRLVSGGLGGTDKLLFMNSAKETIGIVDSKDCITGVYEGFKLATITTPQDCSFVALNIKVNAFDSRGATVFCDQETFYQTHDLNRINAVRKIFNKDIWDVKTETRLNNFIDSVKSSTRNIYNYLDHYRDGYLVNTKGNIQKVDGWGCGVMPIKPNTTYSIYLPLQDYGGTIGHITFFNKDEKYITKYIGSENIGGSFDNQYYVTLTSPPEGALLGVTTTKPNVFDNSKELVVVEGSEVEPEDLKAEVSEIGGKSVVTTKTVGELLPKIEYNYVNLYNFQKHYKPNCLANVDGVLQNFQGWGTGIVPAKENTSYCIYFPSQNYNNGARGNLLCMDGDRRVLEAVSLVHITKENCAEGVYMKHTTPEGTRFIAFTVHNANLNYDDRKTAIVVEGERLDTVKRLVVSINDVALSSNNNTQSQPLKGKKWVVVGDSLTEFNIRATKNYHDYVAEETGCRVVNMGVSGSGYKKREDTGHAFYQRIANIPTDTDIVTIFGSGNDLSLTLGNPTDTTTDTICGCMNKTLEVLFERLPGVKVGIALPCPWGGYPPKSKGNKMMLYSEALREVAKNHSVPVLDLYYESNLRPWDNTFRELYYKRDDGNSVHPDEDGQKILANKFKMFIQSL